MDPHSRHSQFNQRTPRTGPYPTATRFAMEPPQKPTLESFSKRSKPARKSSSASSASTSLRMSRPIATNSRVKQDEKYRQDMYLAFVNNALQQKTNGNSEPFDELVNQFNPNRTTGDNGPPPTQLKLWILALSHVISRLERQHAALVEAIVAMPWTTMDTAIVKSYTVFIGMLLSARPEYLSLVLGKIAQGFTHQSGLHALNSGQPEGSSKPITRRDVYDRLHYLLRHILSLIPTLPNTLHPLLMRNFPHKRQNQLAQVTYIRNLLRVTDYCPELGDRILATIIDRAIQIDVEIQVELEELEEISDSQDQGAVFDLDPFDTVVGQDGSDSDSDDDSDDEDNLSDMSSDAEAIDEDTEDTSAPMDMNHIQDMVTKLDSILKLIFEHFSRNHTREERSTALSPPLLTPRAGSPASSIFDSVELPRPSSPISIERGKALRRSQFHTLLSIFDRTIIRTFKSRYTQFLVFWYSSLDPEFSDLFQGMLVEKALLDRDQPAVTRAAAASYIASFVSRARFVDREGARRVVAVLCDFLRSHLDAWDAYLRSHSTAPGMAQHGVFYAVAQAVFLIFCFRWRDLLEDQGEEELDELIGHQAPAKKWMDQLSVVQRVVTSTLNPLKVCSANVVMQFARVSQATDFIYCYSIMETNKRSEYNSEGKSGDRRLLVPVVLGDSLNMELNTFFPFDPYKLPRSNSFIQGVYREWSSVAIDDDEEEEDEDDDDDDDEGVESEYAGRGNLDIPRPLAQDGDDGALGASFEGMSISPMRPGQMVSAMS
ncbi:hypothetical protein PLICRDRAFT_98907 [Plicaturopsis crispa FD-325 SS-3]|nr:hypothetical protein PLICRDRAFT_98907 [Plicaturopsis crispa FD-325 SS-3]